MSKVEINSSFFIDDSDFPKYIKDLPFVNNDDEYNELLKFIESNNNSIIQTFQKYKNYLVYGDVQSGKTNNLMYIAEKVVSKYNYNYIIFLAGTKNNLMFQNQIRFFESFKKMNKDKYSIFNSKGKGKRNISALNHINKAGMVAIIHSLKRPETLNDLYETISMSDGEKRILIIDDEGDEASLSPKTMNAISLFSRYENTKFISITATPFSNLASKEMKYDYFHVLKSPSSYTSLKQMDKCLVEIKKDNVNAIAIPLIKFAETVIDNGKQEAQILFNIFNEKDSHKQLSRIIKDYMDQFTSVNVLEDFKTRFDITFDSVKISEFFKSLDDRNIITSNGDNPDIQRRKIEIIIGGLKLSRGITYDNLLSEVMLNMGDKIKAATLIQRARWLGYRGEDVNIIKVYTTREIKEAFGEARHLIKWTKNYHIHTDDFMKKFNASDYERIEL